MTRRALALAASLSVACRDPSAVGYLAMDAAPSDLPRPPADASNDATNDVPNDAPSADVAPDHAPAADRPIAPELSGLGSRAVALLGDRYAEARGEQKLRVAYVDARGQLRVERRDSRTMRRECAVDLGAPPAADIASSPAADVPLENVYVTAREREGGALAIWRRPAADREGACGAEALPWERLPTPPAGGFVTGVGAAAVHGPDFAWRSWVAALSASGVALVTEGVHTGASTAWSAWLATPGAPDRTAIRSRPQPGNIGVNAGRVWALLEGAEGDATLAFRHRRIVPFEWQPGWIYAGLGAAPPRSAPAFRVAFRTAPAGQPSGVERSAYVDARGHVWSSAELVLDSGEQLQTPWQDVGAPFEGTLHPPAAAVALDTWHSALSARSPLVAVAVPEGGPRALAWSTVEYLTWTRWQLAPDPLE